MRLSPQPTVKNSNSTVSMRTAYRSNSLIYRYELTHIQVAETEPMPDEKDLLITKLQEQIVEKDKQYQTFLAFGSNA